MLEIIINNSSIISTDKTKSKSQDEKIDQNKIKSLNDSLDEIINKSKSFEDQIESLKRLEGLKEYCFMEDFYDKKLKLKIHLADMPNKIDEKLFENIFGHNLIKIVDELINTTNKEKNEIIVDNICKNQNRLFEMDDSNDWMIQPSSQHIKLLYGIDLILNFNKTIQLDLF